MAVKISGFVLFLLIIIVYPLFINDYKENKNQNIKKTLPEITLIDGKFKIYDKQLEKKGYFKKFDVFKNAYVANDLFAEDLLKKEKYTLNKAIFKNELIRGYNLIYENKDLLLKTKTATYNKQTKILNGGVFQIYAKEIKGYGNSFRIDNNKNLFAQNITYFIKVKK
jgi:hypothetical protein